MLALAWDATESDGLLFLQREKKYDTVSAFLDNLPDREQIAVYNYTPASDYLIPAYASSSETEALTIALRGSYQFYTYIKNEDLNFDFGLVDLNLNRDSDPVAINLYYNNALIASRRLDDDGIAEESGVASDLRQVEINEPNLPEGAYKLEFKANDDIITKEIITKQSKLAFINNLRLADSGNDNIVLYTDSSELHAKTTNPAKLQTIRFDGGGLEIKETYRQYDAYPDASTTKVVLAQDDVYLSGDGVFSFSRSALINPAFKKVKASLDINRAGINYVLAGYMVPADKDGWSIARAGFDLTGAYRENGQYSFIISIPGLKGDDNIDDYVEVGEIKVELQGITLYNKIKGFFSNK